MSEIDEEVSKIGAAAHQAAVASQNLSKLHKEAEERISKIADLSEKAKKLHKEVSDLSAAKAKLEEEVSTLKAEKARILTAFSAVG